MFYEKRKSNMLSTRIAQRKPTDEKALYKLLDRDRFYARFYQGVKNPISLIDISTTGCAFKVNNFIPKGSYLEIQLDRLSKKHVFESPIIAACEAVYCRYISRTTNRVGAKFLEIKRDDIEKIREFTE